MPSALSGLLGSGSSKGGNYSAGLGTANTYVPQYQQQNDQSFEQLIQAMQGGNANPASATLPTAYGAANSIVQNPYINSYQGQTNANATAMGQIGAADRTQGQYDSQSADAAMPYLQQILQTGFDPQNALYNKTFQQTQDQINAQNAMEGLGTSPVGASIADNALGNFNLNWQNNLLNRENTATQGYNTLSGSINNQLDTGANLKSAGVNLAQQGAGLPYNTANSIANNDLGALSTLSGQGTTGANQNNQILNDLLAYLGKGQGASQIANSAAGNAFGNATAGAGSLGSIISQLSGGGSGGLGGLFGGGGGGAAGFLEGSGGLDSFLGAVPEGATDLGATLPWLALA